MAATTLSVRPNRLSPGSSLPRPAVHIPNAPNHALKPWRGADAFPCWRTLARTGPLTQASSRADDPAPSEMSLEIALKLLGVAETASFDEILRAKNSVIASCKDNQEAIAQVEAAYDMLLMRSLTRRRAGKVVSSSVRYADVKVKSVASSSGGGGGGGGVGSMPQWLQSTIKKSQVSVDTPSTTDIGLQVGVYGALMALTYVNGTSTSSVGGADVPGLILATSFGASLYFMTKKNVKLGKASIITVGGLVAGAVVGSTVENWLQVDIVPFLRINSPAAVVTEFILFSQLLVSLYLR